MKTQSRVLAPSHPDVLALSQGRADLFALRAARVPLGATRGQSILMR
jgi:hypothetical protein